MNHQLNPKNGHRFLPYIVTIIDEYSQLVLGTGGPEGKAHARSIMTSIISIAQMGRACGLHLVIATQTPRREVISGLIKANFPMSIAFTVKTDVDSRVILDEIGAEKLLGKGDMLINGVVQGSIYQDLREDCARKMASMDIDVHPMKSII